MPIETITITDTPARVFPGASIYESVRIVSTGRIIVGSGDDLRTAGTVVEPGEAFTRFTDKALYAVALDGDCTAEVETGSGTREVEPKARRLIVVEPRTLGEPERYNADGVVIRDLGDCPALD